MRGIRLFLYKDSPPIPTHYLKRALKLILQENSFEFTGKNYLQTHGTTMGTKMGVAFANIFMAVVETEILNLSVLKPLVWKRYIDDIFSIWNVHKHQVTQFTEQANKQTSATKLSSSRLKYHILRLRSLTQTFSKANDSQTNLYWT